MRILVTGAKGFVGKNLCEALKNIRDGKDRREQYQSLLPLTIYELDRNSSDEDLAIFAKDADFVFNLAGINRPKDDIEFVEGNVSFVEKLLSKLEEHRNTCPVVLTSSQQASLEGRYAGSKYGESKLAGEQLCRDYSSRTGAPVLIYRLPNLYGKWCKPNYNSAVATFCNNIANDLPIQVNDENTKLELLYIDDLVTTFLDAACQTYSNSEGADKFFSAEPTDIVTLGEIVNLLYEFKNARNTLGIPNLSDNSFSKKLCSTYESYLNPNDFSYPLDSNSDSRGSFTELLKTPDRGQVSINVTAPGQIKGNHWHNTKWEKFIVVSGEGVVQQRKIGFDVDGNPFPKTEYKLNGLHPSVVDTPPGYTHNLINTSDTLDLITIIWCNEVFDPGNPDTYFEEV